MSKSNTYTGAVEISPAMKIKVRRVTREEAIAEVARGVVSSVQEMARAGEIEASYDAAFMLCAALVTTMVTEPKTAVERAAVGGLVRREAHRDIMAAVCGRLEEVGISPPPSSGSNLEEIVEAALLLAEVGCG